MITTAEIKAEHEHFKNLRETAGDEIETAITDLAQAFRDNAHIPYDGRIRIARMIEFAGVKAIAALYTLDRSAL